MSMNVPSPEFNSSLPGAPSSPPATPLASTSTANSTLITPPPAAYLPYGPEMLHRTPYLPYDIPGLPFPGHLMHGSLIPPPSMARYPPTTGFSAPKLSPSTSAASSPHSPESSSQHNTSQTNCGDENSSTKSDGEDDEPIDVVKSAFAPVLKPTMIQGKFQIADSTTSPIEISDSIGGIKRPGSPIECDIKSAKCRKLSEDNDPKATISSPGTKINAQSITSQKAVWRPY